MSDLNALADEILFAAAEALGKGARLVSARAKRHAPVRSVMAGTPSIPESGYIRPVNIGERMSERTALIKAGLPPRPMGEVTTREAPVWWRQRTTQNLEQLYSRGQIEARRPREDDDLVEPQKFQLSRRGAYEVRTRRAEWTTWGRTFIGGRLRGEIYATEASMSGSRAEAWVISPTRYAKYQEFGTVHNRAHPFLRPAAEESRQDVAALVKAAVERATRTKAGSAQIIIKVRL